MLAHATIPVYEISEETRARFAAERRSKVTFDPGSAVLEGISEGRPRVLSDLKTLLEKASLEATVS